ncbi:hypothetical protein GCM10007981_14160 [Thermocladium modestius]|uniref:PEGA domain-containing protein n=2 Tax=Thermocladium modestius TaxID=62609 RepID=A0A830GWA6_9CREN|nr:hypothetical protein GCM10007981_14160 [Thermocladium modestius]
MLDETNKALASRSIQFILLSLLAIITVMGAISFGLEINGQQLMGISTGNGYIVAVGIYHSSGVIDFFSINNGGPSLIKSITLPDELYGVAYGNGEFMIVGTSGSGGPFVGMVNPSTYSIVNLTNSLGIKSGAIYGVAYGNGEFMIVGTSNGKALAAVFQDGKFQTIAMPSTYESLAAVAYGDNEFMMGGTSMSGAALGVFNATFTDYSGELPRSLVSVNAIAYGDGEFMIGGLIESGNYTFGEVGLWANDSFAQVSIANAQFSTIMSILYSNYEFSIGGGLTNGNGGIAYYWSGGSGVTAYVSSTEPLFPMIIYGLTPLPTDRIAYVGNDGINSVVGIASPPPIYNVSITVVNVSSTPIIELLGTSIKSDKAILHLMEGSYELTISAPGYYNVSESIYVNGNANYTVSLQRVRYCSLSIHSIINSSSIPANITLTMQSQPPNRDIYVLPINGSAVISLICNQYSYRASGNYLEPVAGTIDATTNKSLNISLIPIVILEIRSPPTPGEYFINMSGPFKAELPLSNGSSITKSLSEMGVESYSMYRHINGVIQFLGNTTAMLLPGMNYINITWLTPIITSFNVSSLAPGNTSISISYALSRHGNITITLNGSSIYALGGVKGNASLLFNKSGTYDLCAYSWVYSYGKQALTYGPLCLTELVTVYYRLEVSDEARLISNLSGYYMPNSTVPIKIPSIVYLGNSTRLAYNGSTVDGRYINESDFYLNVNSSVVFLHVKWIKEYDVTARIYAGSSLMSSFSGWKVAGYNISFAPLIQFSNDTRLVLSNESNIVINGPLNITIVYYVEYLVGMMRESPLGIINSTSSWMKNATLIRISPSMMEFNNGTRLLYNESREITVTEPLNITINFNLQYKLTNITDIDGAVWLKNESWINNGSYVVNNPEPIIYQGNETRLVLSSTNASNASTNTSLITIVINGPLTILNKYVRQWLITLTVTDLNGTMIEEFPEWINSSSPIITSIKIGNFTAPVEAVKVEGPGKYVLIALMAERKINVKDALGLPVPDSRIGLYCDGYAVANESNYAGYVYVMIPINAHCLISRPTIGMYSIASIAAVIAVAIIVLSVMIRRRRR